MGGLCFCDAPGISLMAAQHIWQLPISLAIGPTQKTVQLVPNQGVTEYCYCVQPITV